MSAQTHEGIPIEPPDPSPYLLPWANPGRGQEPERYNVSGSKFCAEHDYRWRGPDKCMFCQEAPS